MVSAGKKTFACPSCRAPIEIDSTSKDFVRAAPSWEAAAGSRAGAAGIPNLRLTLCCAWSNISQTFIFQGELFGWALPGHPHTVCYKFMVHRACFGITQWNRVP